MRELEVAVALTVGAVAVYLATVLAGLLDPWDPLSLTLLATGLIAPWFKVVDTVASASSLRKSAEQELSFAVITTASVSRTGLELSDFLKHASNSRLFRGLRLLGERYAGLSELFGYERAMSYLARLFPGRTRLLLSGYTSSLNSGTALYYLRDKAYEYFKGIALEVERAVNSRVMLAMIMMIFFGVAPMVLLAVGMLQTVSVEEGLVEPGFSQLYMALVPAVATPLALTLIPGYPVGISLVFKKKAARLLTILFATGSIALVLPAAAGLVAGDLELFKAYAQASSLVAMALGVPGLYLTLKGIYASRVERAVDNALNHVRVWRSLVNYKDSVLESELGRPARPWIADFLSESLAFASTLGDCDPNIFELLVLSVHELYRGLKKYSQTAMMILAVSALVPVLNASILQLGSRVYLVHALIAYSFTIAYGYVASKLVLGGNTSTLIPGLTALIFTMSI